LPWWYFEPQRGRSNNSVIFLRYKGTKKDFDNFWEIIKRNQSGEPGIFFSNNADWGGNPCSEISLRNNQFCNLTEINGSNIENQEDFNQRCKSASFLGTLQAGYTDFNYIRDVWKENTEKDALLGISITGIAGMNYKRLNLEEGIEVATKENVLISNLLGVKPAARLTCVKPSGTTSLVLGTSSGCHAWFSDYYIRRIKVNKQEPIYTYLKNKIPELLEDDRFNPSQDAFICIPISAPESAILARNETAKEFLERVAYLSKHWIKPGHKTGDNSHNVSATVYVKDNEWDFVGNWMWENRELFNGLAVFPFDGSNYPQAPHEEISKEKYEEMVKYLKDVDLSEVIEEKDETKLSNELACSGDSCSIVHI